jgi:hypothetical protein
LPVLVVAGGVTLVVLETGTAALGAVPTLAVFVAGFLATCFLLMPPFWSTELGVLADLAEVVAGVTEVDGAAGVAGATELVAGAGEGLAAGDAGWLFWAKAGMARAATPAMTAARERGERLFMARDPVLKRVEARCPDNGSGASASPWKSDGLVAAELWLR